MEAALFPVCQLCEEYIICVIWYSRRQIRALHGHYSHLLQVVCYVWRWSGCWWCSGVGRLAWAFCQSADVRCRTAQVWQRTTQTCSHSKVSVMSTPSRFSRQAHGAVVQRVERWTCDNRSWVQILLRAILDTFTCANRCIQKGMCLCHQAV